ncbi:tRNA pseudouridine synthase A, partial [gut metagenome]
RFPIPTMRFYSHFTYVPMDVEKMREASQYLLGEHDFKSFCGANAQVKTTVREIQDIQISKEQDMITIQVRGNGFLYNMVRILVGTLMEVGAGAYPPAHIKEY